MDQTQSTSRQIFGYKAWCKEYADKIINPKDLQAKVEAFMENFEKKEAEAIASQKRRAGEPDEEGWITVTRSGRRKGAPRTETTAQRAVEKKGKKAKETLTNFYTFQARETKLKNVEDLRRKFEDDKKRLAGQRVHHKFKPY